MALLSYLPYGDWDGGREVGGWESEGVGRAGAAEGLVTWEIVEGGSCGGGTQYRGAGDAGRTRSVIGGGLCSKSKGWGVSGR